ncbi:hypothetical protein BG011_004975 [Mortierella polycephala]|uniref:Uncharacterized protein n=1 Tax=Mortierella polycephala TaxID=41804 RepID=A0A9P6Q009_9FUNG|nr:hypothetical protein BG011_004975 [Mortierella polycephala]
MLSSIPIKRLVTVTNATKLFRRTLTSSNNPLGFFSHSTNSLRTATPSTRHYDILASPCHLGKFGQQSPIRFFSRSVMASSVTPAFARATVKATTTSPFVQGQAVRGFCRKAWRAEHEAHINTARDAWTGAFAHNRDIQKHAHAHWRRWGGGFRGYHHSHDHRHHMRRRGPMRFLWRMMFLSTVFVAVPAILVFDAPTKALVLVPLTVAGVGGALILTGRLLFILLPLMAVGGAAVFWMTTMPAASTVKDLKKILDRDAMAGRHTSALSVLGPNWQVQSARPDEWFRWTFPEMGDKDALDKIDIRMTVFDPNDYSDRKFKTMWMVDRVSSEDHKDEFKRRCKKNKGRDGEDDRYALLKNLNLRREGDHFLIQMEEDGERIMDQKWAKKYLALGQLVDRAAKEMETAQPSLKLGDQVVLVHNSRDHEDSFWGRWSPFGGISVRIPFSRTWVQDLSDE